MDSSLPPGHAVLTCLFGDWLNYLSWSLFLSHSVTLTLPMILLRKGQLWACPGTLGWLQYLQGSLPPFPNSETGSGDNSKLLFKGHFHSKNWALIEGGKGQQPEVLLACLSLLGTTTSQDGEKAIRASACCTQGRALIPWVGVGLSLSDRQLGQDENHSSRYSWNKAFWLGARKEGAVFLEKAVWSAISTLLSWGEGGAVSVQRDFLTESKVHFSYSKQNSPFFLHFHRFS